MNYLHIGCDEIRYELFDEIKNTEKPRPHGGFWLTEQDLNRLDYNEWMSLLSINIKAYFYKYPHNKFDNPAVLVYLKDNTNIYNINSKESLDYLLTNYPTDNNWIDFESLSQYYDGIHIDLESLIKYELNKTELKIYEFHINTLILFNLECISYYNDALVSVEPFDYEWDKYFTKYHITIYNDNIKTINNITRTKEKSI